MKITDVFLFAHQDDEFSVFSLIAKSIRNGNEVAVYYFADGSDNKELESIRNNESTRVLEVLGVSTVSIFFLGKSSGMLDGQLYQCFDKALNLLEQHLHKIHSINSMFIPAYEGGHQDHDTLHVIGVVASKNIGILNRTYQCPSYTGYGLPWKLFRLFYPLPGNGSVVKYKIPVLDKLKYARLCLKYPSQKRTWIGLFPFVVLNYLFGGKQIVQNVSIERLQFPATEQVPLYERRGVFKQKELQNRIFVFLKKNHII